MSTYTPDSWVIVKIQSEKYGTIHRVLAGWAGSHLYGASWKLSSGIVTFEDKGEHYESLQDSGSAVGATMFCTLSCCELCANDIIDAGIVEFLFLETYRDTSGLDLLKQAGIITRQVQLQVST